MYTRYVDSSPLDFSLSNVQTLSTTSTDPPVSTVGSYHDGFIKPYHSVQQSEIRLCTCVREEGDDGEDVCSETPSLLLYTRRYVSFTEVYSVCRVVFREPMHLCTFVSEEGDDGNTISDVIHT